VVARLNAGAPLLNSHESSSLASILGTIVPGTARLEGSKGIARVQLSRRADVAGIVQDVRDGVIRNASVGYKIHEVIKSEGRKDQVPVWRVTDWEPHEISLVAIVLAVDEKIEFRRLLDGEVARFRAFQDFVDEMRRAPVHSRCARCGHVVVPRA
jgi:phage head maturation protease